MFFGECPSANVLRLRKRRFLLRRFTSDTPGHPAEFQTQTMFVMSYRTLHAQNPAKNHKPDKHAPVTPSQCRSEDEGNLRSTGPHAAELECDLRAGMVSAERSVRAGLPSPRELACEALAQVHSTHQTIGSGRTVRMAPIMPRLGWPRATFTAHHRQVAPPAPISRGRGSRVGRGQLPAARSSASEHEERHRDESQHGAV